MLNRFISVQKSRLITDTIVHTVKRLASGKNHKEIIILESQHPEHQESKCTYLAAFPKKKLVVKGTGSEWHEERQVRRFDRDPWSVFRQFRQNTGWLFGFIGYDMKNQIEPLESSNPELCNAPDLFMMEPSILFRIERGSATQLLGDPLKIKDAKGAEKYLEIESITPSITKKVYKERVAMIKDLIKEGDFYELNYTYPITARLRGDSYELYKRMRQINPVPFGSYIEINGLKVCCMSPERFLKNSGGNLISEPIKGTSGRSTDPGRDTILRNELKSVKNEAENLMIVDLVRHDLSRVCKPGTVRVAKLFDIQTFGTVHQLISQVEGTMMPHTDPVDAIKACFPMGSMTGAPKLRVMQKIEELEVYKRGIYSGSIGYFTPDGDFDFNVVIRTSIICDNKLVYPVGGAITGDSDPELEWKETLIKSRVLTSI